MSIVSCWTLAVVALSQLLLPPAFAAQQLVTTKTLLVKNPPSGARKVLWKVKETAATVVGNPITEGGATLRIQLTPGGDQCVTMPAAGWSAIGTIGFKYKDATLTNGPVKVALIKKTPSGTFLVKALLKTGGPASIAVTPGNPTASYATNFTLGTGDEYCGGTGSATPDPNDANTFKVSNDGAPAVSCIASCNGMSGTTTSTTTSTSVTTTTTSTTTTTTAPTTTSTTVPNSGNCGNNVTEPLQGELCDGIDLPNPNTGGQATCSDFLDPVGNRFDEGKGELRCTANCTFDTSGCQYCGNGIAEGTEPCDGADLRGQSCTDFGYGTGTLACTSSCTLVFAGCVP